jgi:putative PEP-CTERM system histidine kinase
MTVSVTLIGAISYSAGALAFLALSIPLLLHWKGHLQGTLMVLACVATAAWTGAAAVNLWTGLPWPQIVPGLEVLRTLSFIFLLVSMVYPRATGLAASRLYSLVAVMGLILASALVAFGVLRVHALYLVSIDAGTALGLLLAVTGIVLTEVLYRNTPAQKRWSMKFLCIATGAIFAYDLFLYAETMLFRTVDQVLVEARGAVQALVTPLLAAAAVRNDMWQTNISLSRQVVVRSAALLASGIYLVLMALAGVLLREIDEVRGPVVQVIFFVGAIGVLLVVLFSGTSKAYLKIFINKHFYAQRYDWREEWLRFMRTLSAGTSAAALEARAINAVADIVDSPGGAMWLLERDCYRPVAFWNLTALNCEEHREGSLAQFLAREQWVIDLEQVKSEPQAYKGLVLPKALREHERAWLIVPLWHHSLTGFILLARARAPRPLGWEDYDLLKIVGRQTASYLAEQRAAQALDQAREFEIFNRRFAFVIHDIKNLISQLSLLGTNIEKYGDNKAFREDMVETLKDATVRMQHMMERIHSRPQEDVPGKEIAAVAPMISSLIEAKKHVAATLIFECNAAETAVLGSRERLEAVMGHLIENAIDAVGDKGCVRIGLKKNGSSAIIEVTDDGPGMDNDFIRNELFKPFRSTKNRGMGIGAFQCREYAREMGGNLEAISAPGKGTTMRVTLPLAELEVRTEPASPSQQSS